MIFEETYTPMELESANVIADVTPEECIKAIRHNAKTNRACNLLAGAGISIPSGLPSGMQFKQMILDQIPRQENGPLPICWHNKLRDDERFRKRLQRMAPELLLQRLYDVRPSCLNGIVNAFNGFKPNSSHLCIVRAHLQGYWNMVATTNFDDLLENALPRHPLGVIAPTGSHRNGSPTLLKLHGTWGVSEGQIVRLIDTWRGKANVALQTFTSELRDRDLVVCGYSGFDFDILINILRGGASKVYWICDPRESGFSNPELPYLFTGTALYRVNCDLHEFLGRLAGPADAAAECGPSEPAQRSAADFALSVRLWAEKLHILHWLEFCGYMLFELLELSDSVKVLRIASEICQFVHDSEYVIAHAKMLRKMSLAYLYMRQYAEGKKHITASVDLLLEAEMPEQAAIAGATTLRILEKLGAHDFADEWFEKLFPAIRDEWQHNGKYFEEYLDLCLYRGNVLLRKQAANEAEVAYRAARSEASAYCHIAAFIDATFRLCQLLIKRNETNALREALTLTSEAMRWASIGGYPGMKHRVASLLPYIYRAIGDLHMAGRSLAMVHALADEAMYPHQMGNWSSDAEQ